MLRSVACASRNIRERSSVCGRKSSSSTRLSARPSSPSKKRREYKRSARSKLSKPRSRDFWPSTPLSCNNITLRPTLSTWEASKDESTVTCVPLQFHTSVEYSYYIFKSTYIIDSMGFWGLRLQGLRCSVSGL